MFFRKPVKLTGIFKFQNMYKNIDAFDSFKRFSKYMIFLLATLSNEFCPTFAQVLKRVFLIVIFSNWGKTNFKKR